MFLACEAAEYIPDEDLSAKGLANKLLEDIPILATLALVKNAAGNTGTCPGTCNPSSDSCFVCKGVKHEVAWMYKQAGTPKTTRTVTGGQCSACYKACRLLQISRSEEVLRQHGVLTHVRSVSQKVFQERSAKDNLCTCHCCSKVKA